MALETPAAPASPETATDSERDEVVSGSTARSASNDAPSANRQPRSQSDKPPVFWLTAAAALMMIVGGFGTWASVTSVFGSLSVAGTSGDGWFLIAGGAIGGGLLFSHVAHPHAWKPILMTGAGLLGLIPAVIDFSNIHDVTRDSQGVLVQIGWGLYISVIASAVLLVAAVYTAVKHPYSDRPA